MLLFLYIELNPVKEGTFIIGGRAWGFRGEGHPKKLDPEGGSTLILKGIKVTRPSFFEGVPSYFEALWYPHLYFYRKSNT